MKKLLKILGVLVAVLILVILGVYIWATMAANRVLAQTFSVHSYDFPVPFPMSEADAPGASETDRQRMAAEQAIARGQAPRRVALCLHRVPRCELRRRDDD